MASYDFLLYGANGYTGRLIAERCAAYGVRPLLAGRNAEAVHALGRALGFDSRILSLDDGRALDEALGECRLAVHAAGPFRHTLDAMVGACLRTGRHYVDINGDISCFERIHAYDGRAREAGIMLLPGAGFDVVPTDCLALSLKQALPEAVRLRIAFASIGSTLSHGTALTMAGKLGEGGMVRRGGILQKRPYGEKGMTLDFDGEGLFVMSIPWGDVFTAWHTTGIPDIEAYAHVRPLAHRVMRLQGAFNPLLRSDWFRGIVRRRIEARPAGPDAGMRLAARTLVRADAEDGRGGSATATLQGPEVYDITAHAVHLIVARILKGEFVEGFTTPAGCYGPDLAMGIPGMRRSAVTLSP